MAKNDRNLFYVLYRCIAEQNLGPLANYVERRWDTVKDAWELLIVALLAGGMVVFFPTKCAYDGQIATNNEDTAKALGEKDKEIKTLKGNNAELSQQKSHFEEMYKEAENALAPWKMFAISQYPGKSIDQALPLLLQKVDALYKLLEATATNPLAEPIASATATATVEFATTEKTSIGVNIGQGGFVAFGSGNTPLLIATTPNNIGIAAESGRGVYRIVGEAAADEPYMGKPINSLLDAKYVQVSFLKSLIPANAQIIRGTVTWVINKSVTLKFDIPPQLAGEAANCSKIMITDVSYGLRPLVSADKADLSAQPVNRK